ncbi:hypothetical protein PBI_BERNARDO_66 [Mycobacterium phage Bernardo]|uniref:Uncharacterized protein n=1 Tax=Mycobacterium phage Bernardo TaxID=1429903 RepID=V5R981_9CAUD|nr:hypothetical protein X818_gp066 [Mycobacterium phage Bernardo]AHB31743.1 hypothetical protein PBI_BERNARDO_66 [Mycobacterium phage Bernardo]
MSQSKRCPLCGQRERELLDQVRAIAEKAAALRPWVDNEGPTVDAADAANEVGNDILDVLGMFGGAR